MGACGWELAWPDFFRADDKLFVWVPGDPLGNNPAVQEDMTVCLVSLGLVCRRMLSHNRLKFPPARTIVTMTYGSMDSAFATTPLSPIEVGVGLVTFVIAMP